MSHVGWDDNMNQDPLIPCFHRILWYAGSAVPKELGWGGYRTGAALLNWRESLELERVGLSHNLHKLHHFRHSQRTN